MNHLVLFFVRLSKLCRNSCSRQIDRFNVNLCFRLTTTFKDSIVQRENSSINCSLLGNTRDSVQPLPRPLSLKISLTIDPCNYCWKSVKIDTSKYPEKTLNRQRRQHDLFTQWTRVDGRPLNNLLWFFWENRFWFWRSRVWFKGKMNILCKTARQLRWGDVKRTSISSRWKISEK